MAIVNGSTCLQFDLSEHPAAPRRTPGPELGYYIAPGTGGHGRARADGLLAVIQAFACRVGVSGYDATRRDKFLIMVAARPVLDALDLLLPRVALQMETAARAAAKAYGQEVRSALPAMSVGQRRSALKIPYFRNYLRGFGQGVAETIREIRAEFIQAEGDHLRRILAEQDRRAEDAYRRGFPDPAELRKEQARHLDGFLEGQDAGRAVDLGDEYLAQHDLVFAML
jgi:hypothetical protein